MGGVNSATPVEVEPGQLKPFGDCTPAECRAAYRLGEIRIALLARWRELVEDLGEVWIPQTDLVMRLGANDIPDDLTTPQMEAEVAKLEAALEMKRLGTGSIN